MKNTTIEVYELTYKELMSMIETYILTNDPQSSSNLGPGSRKILTISGVNITPNTTIKLRAEKKEI